MLVSVEFWSNQRVTSQGRECVEIEKTYRDKNQGRVCLNPGLVGRADEADGAHGAGDKQLHCQNGVDLADELVADVDGGFGHAAAELEVIGNVVLARPANTIAACEEARFVVSGGGLVGGWCLREGWTRWDAVGVLLRGGRVLRVGHGD